MWDGTGEPGYSANSPPPSCKTGHYHAEDPDDNKSRDPAQYLLPDWSVRGHCWNILIHFLAQVQRVILTGAGAAGVHTSGELDRDVGVLLPGVVGLTGGVGDKGDRVRTLAAGSNPVLLLAVGGRDICHTEKRIN